MPASDPQSDVLHTFARLREREKQRFRDAHKGQIPCMDAETLRELCVDNEGYETPELNDNLYAHFRGFQKIEGLEPYYNLKALWLESNGLTRLENLAPLVHLRCLYASKNLIEKIENLECLKQLNTLDLSENRITSLTGLACLPLLASLNVSRNLLQSRVDLSELVACTELTNIDVSHNQIHDTSVLEVFTAMPKLRALRITGNDVVSTTKSFRKVYIAQMPELAFLDRPIFPLERTGVEAWARGGNEAELAAKRAFVSQEHEARRRDLHDFRAWQAQVRERRVREIAEEQAAKQKEQSEKEQQPEMPSPPPLREQDVDLRGFRGITKQEYIKLSPAERTVWDARIEAAHQDSQRAREHVRGEDAVVAMGSAFWASASTIATSVETSQAPRETKCDMEEAKINGGSGVVETAPVKTRDSVTVERMAVTTAATIAPPSIMAMPPPPPVATSHAVPAATLALTIEKPRALEDDATPATAASEMQSAVEISSPPPLSSQEEDAATAATMVFHRDPATFFGEVGSDTRRSWAELEQRAREAPFLHRPSTLPSMLDHDDEEDDGQKDQQADDQDDVPTATCAGFPVRALTRDEILRQLSQRNSATASTGTNSRASVDSNDQHPQAPSQNVMQMVMPPPAPSSASVTTSRSSTTGFPAAITNVAALD